MDCHCANLRAAARHITQLYDHALADTGLRTSQFSVLRKIRALGPVTMQDLAAALVMDRTTMARTVTPLERDGLIAIGRAKEDKRAKQVTLTTSGRERLAVAEKAWARAQSDFEASFGAQQSAALRTLLGQVIRGLMTPRGRLTTLIVLAIFLIFFQAFMVAPLIPRLAIVFATTVDHASILVPAYTLPYGVLCLIVGPLADRHGRARLLRWLVAGAVLLPVLTITATSLNSLIFWRVISGAELGGIAPIALAMIATMYPYEERGRPVGWVFGAIAGGMALGATFGPWLEPALGWRGLFGLVGVLQLAVAIPMWRTLRAWPSAPPSPPVALVRTYLGLLATRKGGTVYAYVFLNGAFHSGVFSWLGVYFTARYHLAPRELGYAMLGYGIPGFLLGPVVGKLADRLGRPWLIRAGLLIAALCALALSAPLPALGATVVITALSFGLDLSHPLFSGIVSTLDPVRTAQAMALNTFMIFVGFGMGSMAFGALYAAAGMATALVIFGSAQLLLALASLPLFDQTWR